MRATHERWTWMLAATVSGLAALAACAPEEDAITTPANAPDDGDRNGDDGDAATGDASAPVDAASDGGPTPGTPDGGSVVPGTPTYCGYDAQIPNAALNKTSKAAWTCTATTRSLAANGIPDHAPGQFPNPNCPNTIAETTVAATMPFVPALTGGQMPVQITGYAINGVKLEPGTGGTCSVSGATTTCNLNGGGGSWRIEALGQSSFDFGVDSSNAHVQPTGAYHYHGMPNGLVTRLAKGEAMTLVGFAMDGFPVYAKWGYAVANDATSALKSLTGSYRLKASPDANRPSTTTYPMGAFVQDYEYVAALGDLDACNGRTGVTPEFPGGTYYYAITETYPYIGRCLKGTPGTSNGGGGPGGGDGGMPPPPPPGG